jgi:hypothetical protein
MCLIEVHECTSRNAYIASTNTRPALDFKFNATVRINTVRVNRRFSACVCEHNTLSPVL